MQRGGGEDVSGGVAWCTREDVAVRVLAQQLQDGLDDGDSLAHAWVLGT